jgi:hypothetical protein
MTKKAEREQARELRRRGKSMKAIAREIGVSPGSVHLWTADIDIGDEQRARLADAAHQGNLLKAKAHLQRGQLLRVLKDREQADAEWPSLKLKPDFTFGLALYIGEGSKTDSVVGVTNANPAVLRAALRFFDLIGIEMGRVKVNIVLHQGEDPTAALRHWATELGLPPHRFNKVTTSKVSGGQRARHLIHGTACVKLSAASAKRKLNRWMELAQDEFGRKSSL